MEGEENSGLCEGVHSVKYEKQNGLIVAVTFQAISW